MTTKHKKPLEVILEQIASNGIYICLEGPIDITDGWRASCSYQSHIDADDFNAIGEGRDPIEALDNMLSNIKAEVIEKTDFDNTDDLMYE